MAFSFTRPDPVLLSMALGLKTERMKFMIAIRSGIISPTLFVQQINTLSALTNGRVCINMVTGHTPNAKWTGYRDWSFCGPRMPAPAWTGPSLKALMLRLCARIGYTPHDAPQH